MPAAAASDGPDDDVDTEAALLPAGEATKDKSASVGRLDLDRRKGPLRTALSLALIEILVVALICYVAWGLINAAIMRRMRAELPEDEAEDEKEEGGAGGSRTATLLLLLRKFLLVVILVMASLIVLSALGVHVGPLIAGAGVFGLAIGFGAQTLVKDIISGVFFLMDDAFRLPSAKKSTGSCRKRSRRRASILPIAM